MTLEGYAALFGAADLEGDVVHAGAFRDSLRRRTSPLPMLVQHDARLHAGVWREAQEDARGLYLKGDIDARLPGAALAKRMIAQGQDGLSIGFIARLSQPRGKGRDLFEIELLETSLVAVPMQPLARLSRAGGARLSM
ncbi:MAG: HK97 family phage prohead protease [Hyphomonadaceae bacterium]|nr:HK97 family phage prohead protease [Hyphomonadaceae bacterium]